MVVGEVWLFVNPGSVVPLLFVIIHGFIFVFSWWGLAILIDRFPLYQVLAVVGLLVAVLLVWRLEGIRANSMTIPLLILFWMGVAYLILPELFKKYKIAIFLAYGAVIAYFFTYRSSPDFLENHMPVISYFILLTISGMVILWIYKQWRWLGTLKNSKARAELALLKSQVNPHFFFNTLNNLYGLVVEKSPQAPDVVLQLSDMMRYTIDMGKEDEVHIMDEIDYLENYIALHRIRYQKNVDIQFDHQVKNDAQVAPLLFINLLENAIKHGVESLTESAYIHLSLKVEGNQLVFKIANNFDAKVETQKGGTGLNNLKKRLELIYPNRHHLQIEQTEGIYKAKLTIQTY